MSRVQLALDVTDLEASVAFYSTLFGATRDTGPQEALPGGGSSACCARAGA